jgi:transcriptional regulator with XRE-family HTH domain
MSVGHKNFNISDLKDLRIAMKLTQKELGLKLDLTPSTVSAIESGKIKQPSKRVMDKLAKIFGRGFNENSSNIYRANKTKARIHLKKTRLKNNIPASQVASRASITTKTLTDIENGTILAPSKDVIDRICGALNLSAKRFITTDLKIASDINTQNETSNKTTFNLVRFWFTRCMLMAKANTMAGGSICAVMRKNNIKHLELV